MECEEDSSKPVLSSYGTLSVKGICGQLNYTSTYKLIAKEVTDPKYGVGYEIVYINEIVDLSDKEKQKMYLKKILPPNQVQVMYETLNDPYEDIKKADVDKLCSVRGIGEATALRIIERVAKTADYSEIFVELSEYGLSLAMVQKLLDRYKNPKTVITTIKENPYVLADEVDGVGLKRADEIALAAGISPLSNYRLEAFIMNYLNKVINDEGHLWVQISSVVDFVSSAGDKFTKEQIVKVLKKMIGNRRLYYNSQNKRIGLYKYYKLEEAIAKEIKRLVNAPNMFEIDSWRERVQRIEDKQGWEFTSEQIDGIQTIIQNPVTIITGGGGTGKSSTVSGVLAALPNLDFAQCSLSGKAASRLQEVTGMEGYTIHRLLGFKPRMGFTFNKDNQLGYEMILLDESSMVGGRIFLQLLEAIRTGAKLVMLGDINQLEAIGIGSTFKDMIDSGLIKVVKLTKIMRQAAKSGIITGSLQISKGEQITDKKFVGNKIIGELQDFEVICVEKEIDVIIPMVEAYKKYVKKVDSILDIQLVTPRKDKGKTNVKNINTMIQKLYNPPSPEKNEYEVKIKKEVLYTLREGDKVINRKNNYKTADINGELCPIYNGNIGIVEQIDYSTMTINFQGIGRVIVEKEFWKSIQLAYCITTHLSQGSQFDYVIYGFDFGSYVLLTREQIYTGVSRAKKHCTLISTNDALHFGISTSKIPMKHTYLKDLLN